ncbi:hypothetical protein COCSADRAFT_246415 [Bipolaris sorokiniana ND90Pr]|uniref:Uncharacterized protein n=1 Tax=Cochliobolus sativus (strain ND90Pr / ATCC 201652) TaxID=665912 RepID=M2SS13_COCSN|nr:uncharacterized protein COCSADRAFT_246415 [Bipolaris sorokiniana ND90Pr]EMD59881.1 hypothetical protein COCSADRAFT_246415 [Bipolaris sorokiniana ND90Pr]
MHLPTLTTAFATSPPPLMLPLTRRSPKCNAPRPSIAIAPYPMPLWTSGPICTIRQYPLLTAGQPIGQCSQMIPSFAAPSSLPDDATPWGPCIRPICNPPPASTTSKACCCCCCCLSCLCLLASTASSTSTSSLPKIAHPPDRQHNHSNQSHRYTCTKGTYTCLRTRNKKQLPSF